jgi:hypothetical protein
MRKGWMANAIEHHLRDGTLPFARFRGRFIVDGGGQAFERRHARADPILSSDRPERGGGQDRAGIIGYCGVHFGRLVGRNGLEG